jgi:protein-S-isoprenylcysteine O-methyltransferase Ste14
MLSQSTTRTTSRQLISPVLVVMCLALMLLLHSIIPIRVLFRFPLNLAGAIIAGFGFSVCFLASTQFKKYGTTLYPFSRPTRLVTDGLFRYTRNPMYLGLAVFLAGAWLFLGSLTPAAGVAAFVAVADRCYILYEERQMQTVFGTEYSDYQARTPRWI